MQYRVNVPLLVGLVVGTLVLIGGAYGLYHFQKSRNADRLLTAAAEAREEGDLDKSAGHLYNYLQLRPGDESAMVSMSQTLLDIAEEPRSEMIDVQRAMGHTEATLREHPEQNELRRRLLDFYMERRVLNQALDHIDLLLSRTPNDAELEVMRSVCLFGSASPKAQEHAYKLIGFDPDAEEFDSEAAVAPNDPGVYVRAAMSLRSDDLDEKLADRVVERMIEVNSDSGEAYLARGQYFASTGREDEAKADIRRALELDGEKPEIVIANARLLGLDEQYDEARDMLNKAIEDNPHLPGLYLALAEVEIRADQAEEALAAYDRGLKATPPSQTQLLMFQKTRLQLDIDTPEAARSTIRQMRESAVIQAAYPDYLEARLMMKEGKWFKAAQVFEKYQSFFANNPSFGTELNLLLGMCYERLGQLELAAKAFDEALRLDPDNRMADLSRMRVMAARGGSGGGSGLSRGATSIYDAMAKELAKPKGQQDWEAFDKLAQQYAERTGIGDAMFEVLRAEVLMRREKYPEARETLLAAYEMDPDNLGVRRAAVKLFAADPEQGPVKALRLLDEVVKKFGDMPILRLERADLLSVINDEDLTNQLFSLAEGMEDWPAEQRVQVWRGLAEKFGRLGDREARQECLERVAELAPSDLPALLELFSAAQSAADQQAMRDVQKQILEVVGSQEDPTYQFTEAYRLITEWQTGGRDEALLKKAEGLVDRALANRGEWADLHTLKGRIALVRGDVQAALASYDRAADLGRQDALTLLQYVKLLMNQERYADALERMEGLGEAARSRFLGKEYAESLRQAGRIDEAIVAAQAYATAAPNDAAAQLWLGRFLARASVGESIDKQRQSDLIEQAGKAFEKVVQLNPEAAEGWIALVEFYAASGQGVKADDTIRQAQLVLAEDQNPLMFAHCYQVVNRRMDAEALFEQALDNSEGAARINAARMAATFYLSPSYGQRDGVQKATALINEILRGAAEEVVPPDTPAVRWARTQAARLLAGKGTYQELRDAERLLSSNAQGGTLPRADRLLLAEILAPRPEPVSRQKAAKLLEELGEQQRLSKSSELNLAKLYFALGRWRDCRDQMVSLIARYPEDPEVRISYVQMLLQRGGTRDIDRAVRQVQRLREIAGSSAQTKELTARVAFKKGMKEQAAKALLTILPRDSSQITPEQVPLLRLVAARLTEFEDYPKARKVYELAAKVGGVNEKLALAQFVGEHVDAEEGIEQLESLRDDAPAAAIAQRGLAIIRAIDESDDRQAALFDRVSGVIERGLRDDPDMIALQLQQAEMLDLRRQYAEAVAIYQKLLDRPDLTGFNRAVVLNNLAYLLALANADSESLKQAEQYVNEAVDFLGPSTDILDTRAVVAIVDKRFQDAISDLRLAVIDRPTPSKYFHLATAYMGAGSNEEARLAWNEAIELGLDRESLSKLEREQFDEMKKQLGSGGLTNVSR
ncbi:tetratricopeptide repeat protein [Botrimarina sp.]|uniref:tetratricopeptide repeat protein n=1 Tax=Botrimarina sp. TaxID=2795802 RepID=UPI0032EC462E